jgi:hypothetical protein
VANALNLFRNGASLLANTFGVVWIAWLDLFACGIAISTSPEWALWARLALGIVDAFFMRTAEDLLHHDKRTNIVLSYSGKDALLNVDRIASIRVLGKISVNDRISVIVQENPQNGFARSFVIGPIKSKCSFREAYITLLCMLS